MRLRVDIEQESDGRWMAEVLDLSGVMSYGQMADQARRAVTALALRVLADSLEQGEAAPGHMEIVFAPA